METIAEAATSGRRERFVFLLPTFLLAADIFLSCSGDPGLFMRLLSSAIGGLLRWVFFLALPYVLILRGVESLLGRPITADQDDIMIRPSTTAALTFGALVFIASRLL